MGEEGVGYEVADGIASITLDHPPVNALGLPMLRALVAAIRRAAADAAARAVFLRSAVPRRFCAGLDLAAVLGRSGEEVRPFLQMLYVELSDAQYALGKPSVAVVGGTARGGGMTLAISCDVILAAEGATFGYPEIDIGLPPAIHFSHLPRIVGRHRAFEILFTGRSFGAREAYELGLVSRVVPDADLDAEARSLAETFAAKSPSLMRLARGAFMRQNDLDTRRSIAAAVEDICNAVGLRDSQEGLRAFVEKRQPNWG